MAERVALNFMQRMSGIATLTKVGGYMHKFIIEINVVSEKLQSRILFQAMADAAHPAVILETRKTAPGLRLVDKWAVYITISLLLLYAVCISTCLVCV